MARVSNLGESVNAVVDQPAGQYWYWFGMLPGSAPVEWPIPTGLGDMSSGGEMVKLELLDPFALWNRQAPINRDFSVWVGKCRHYNSLDAHGFVFPGYSEYVDRVGIEGEVTRLPFPGNVKLLYQEEADFIVDACWKTFLRFPLGSDNYSKYNQRVTIHNLEHGAKPKDWGDDMWKEYTLRNSVDKCPPFNPRTDKYLSDFVYFHKLSKVDPIPTDWDMNDYNRNPNRYHHTIIPEKFGKGFFTNPPKSVAETYPR